MIEYDDGETESVTAEQFQDSYDESIGLLRLFDDLNCKVLTLSYAEYNQFPAKLLALYRIYTKLVNDEKLKQAKQNGTY